MRWSVLGVEPGETTVTATTRDGAFSATCRVRVLPLDDVAGAVVEPIADQDWTGAEVKPKPKVTFGGVELTEYTDYTLTYADNVEMGTGSVTITGKGLYEGSKTVTFTIVPQELRNVSIGGLFPSWVYRGGPIVPEFWGISGNGTDLRVGVDCDLTFENNVNVGTARVRVTGMGRYRGEIVKTFEITPTPVNVKVAEMTKYEGDSDPEYEAQVSGLVGSDGPEAISYTITRDPGETPGRSYALTARGAELQGNYAVTYKGGWMYIY